MMFKRDSSTYYNLSEELLDSIVKSEIHPITNISMAIDDNTRVLDIGADSGILSMVLKKTGKNVIIDAIEPNKDACALLENHYRKVYNGYVQDYIDVIDSGDYDYIVLADVLEHLEDPLDFLNSLQKNIRHKTTILVSIPNIAFGAVRLELLCGNFDYADFGLLDRTHLRFFTLKTIKTMMANANLHIQKIIYLQSSIFDSPYANIKPKDYPYNAVRMVENDELSYVYQFVLIIKNQKNGCSDTICEKRGYIKSIHFWKRWI